MLAAFGIRTLLTAPLLSREGAEVGSRIFRNRGGAPWEVHVLDVDLVEVARAPLRALRSLGERLAALAGVSAPKAARAAGT